MYQVNIELYLINYFIPIYSAIDQLGKAGIISLDDEMKYTITANPEAVIMTRNMIKYKTMLLIMMLPHNCTLKDLLEYISKAPEVEKPIRRDDKKLLNDCLSTQIKFNNSVKTKVSEQWHKAYVLLQSGISRVNISDFTLKIEQSEIADQIIRILNALKEYSIERKKGNLLFLSLYLTRSIKLQAWDENQANCGIITYCTSISSSTKQYIISAMGINSVYDIIRGFSGCINNITKIQELVHCNTEDAKQLNIFIQFCLTYSLKVYTTIVKSDNPNSKGSIKFVIKPINENIQCINNNQYQLPNYTFIAISIPTSQLLCYHPITLKTSNCFEYSISIESIGQSILNYFNNPALLLKNIQVHLICNNYIGFDDVASFIQSEYNNKTEQIITQKNCKSTASSKTSSKKSNKNIQSSKSSTANINDCYDYFNLRNQNQSTISNILPDHTINMNKFLMLGEEEEQTPKSSECNQSTTNFNIENINNNHQINNINNQKYNYNDYSQKNLNSIRSKAMELRLDLKESTTALIIQMM